MRGQHFWNYFVSRKARCKILHSAWADTSVAWTEPPSWKTMLKTTLDNGPRMKWLASKVTLMMKDHVSGHGTTLSVSGSPDHIRAASWKEEKEREKESTKVYPKEAEEHSLAKNKHKIPKFGQKRTLLGGSQETRARKACQKAMMAIRRVVFALTTQTKAQARIITTTKAKERTKKEKARKELILNPDFQPQKHPTKKDTAMPGNETIGLPAMGLTIPGLQILGGFAQKLTLHGWRYLFESCSPSDTRGSWPWLHTVDWIESGNRKIEEACMVLWYCDGIWQLWWVLRVRQLRDRNLHGKLHYPLSNDTTMFYQGWRAWDRWRAHLVVSFSDEKLGYDLWTGSKKRQDYVPSFWLVFFSSYDSTVGHIVLDLTSLMCQPTTKSSNRSGYPKKHVIFVMSERKPANLDHAPDMHEEENEDDKPLVRPTARKDPLEEGRGMTHSVEFCCVSIATRRDPVPFGSADPEVSFSVKDLGSQWMGPTPRPRLRGRPCEYDEHNMWNSMLGLFCHVSYFDEVALGGSHSLVTLHWIYSVTKPNSTTVHFWGSLSRQHCPLWEPLSDLRSHDDPSCLRRESLRINFGTGFSCLWVDKYLWWRIQISCPTTDLGFIGRFAGVHMEFGRTTRERSDW